MVRENLINVLLHGLHFDWVVCSHNCGPCLNNISKIKFFEENIFERISIPLFTRIFTFFVVINNEATLPAIDRVSLLKMHFVPQSFTTRETESYGN